jgi:hypothetical protein
MIETPLFANTAFAWDKAKTLADKISHMATVARSAQASDHPASEITALCDELRAVVEHIESIGGFEEAAMAESFKKWGRLQKEMDRNPHIRY